MATYILESPMGSYTFDAKDAVRARQKASLELAFQGFYERGTLSTKDGRHSWDLWFDRDADGVAREGWFYRDSDGGEWKHTFPRQHPKPGTIWNGDWTGLVLMEDGSLADLSTDGPDRELMMYAVGVLYGTIYYSQKARDSGRVYEDPGDLFWPFEEDDTPNDADHMSITSDFVRLVFASDSSQYRAAIDMLEDGASPEEVCRRFGITGAGSRSVKSRAASVMRGSGKMPVRKKPKGSTAASKSSRPAGKRRR